MQLPIGPILLVLLLVAVGFGLADSLLRRIGVPVRAALALLSLMMAGSALNLSVGGLALVNLGAAVVPLLVGVALLIAGSTAVAFLRGLGGAVATAATIFLIGRYFPPGVPTELNLFYMDAQYVYALVGGLVGYLAAQSSRGALGATIIGVLLADLAHLAVGAAAAAPLLVGGGPLYHTPLLAGLLACLLAEWVNEPVIASAEAEQEGGTGRAGDLP